MPFMGLNLCTPPLPPLSWGSVPVVPVVLSRPHSCVQRKTGHDAVTGTPTWRVQVSLVKDRWACLWDGGFGGFIFCGLNTVQPELQVAKVQTICGCCSSHLSFPGNDWWWWQDTFGKETNQTWCYKSLLWTGGGNHEVFHHPPRMWVKFPGKTT